MKININVNSRRVPGLLFIPPQSTDPCKIDGWMVSWKGRPPPPHTCCTTTRGRRELTKPNPLPVSDDEDEIDRKEAGEAQGGRGTSPSSSLANKVCVT